MVFSVMIPAWLLDPTATTKAVPTPEVMSDLASRVPYTPVV